MKWQHIAERPELISQLARWFQDEWGYYNSKVTFESRCEELLSRKDKHTLSLTMVATVGDELIGTYSLDLADLPIRPELSPWLASVFINPEHRKKGVGTLVVKRSLEHAMALGIKTLYLFTAHHASWYASMGWQIMEEVIYEKDEPITIMRFDAP